MKGLVRALYRAGKNPFDPIDDILRPVGSYGDNVEKVIAAATARYPGCRNVGQLDSVGRPG